MLPTIKGPTANPRFYPEYMIPNAVAAILCGTTAATEAIRSPVCIAKKSPYRINAGMAILH